jgi:hypothetical protein
VQFQKSLFLLERHFPSALSGESYSFAPHDYDPFSQASHADAEGLSQAGLAQISTAREGWMQYAAPDAGKVRVISDEIAVGVAGASGLGQRLVASIDEKSSGGQLKGAKRLRSERERGS